MSVTELLLIGVLCVLLLIFGALLALIRKQVNFKFDLGLSTQVEEALQQVYLAISHHADVSAVVEMVRQIEADPDVLELIKSYPETVRAAAWLHYINTLGADLQQAQKHLSDAHQGKVNYGIDKAGVIELAQQHVDTVRAKLHAAIKASGQSGLRPV